MSETFTASGARQSARVSGAGIGSIASGKAGFDGSVTVAYDRATGRYTVSDAGSSQAFDQTHRTGDSNATITVYERTLGSRTDQLAMFNPGAANGTLALTYVSYGAWQTLTDNGGNPGSIDFAQRFFVFGIREASSIPTSGTGTYTTTVDGFWTTSSGLYSLAGTSSFTANFGANSVSTSLSLTGTDITPGSSLTRSLGTFNGTGSLSRSDATFAGTLTHQGTDAGGVTYAGTFDGALFGPGAAETGYTFRVTGSNGVAVGAVVGKKN